MWRVDPFHVPTGLADGLGVESLPRFHSYNVNRFAPAESPELQTKIKVSDEANVERFRTTVKAFTIALVSPRLAHEGEA